jgi:hypothetical protein
MALLDMKHRRIVWRFLMLAVLGALVSSLFLVFRAKPKRIKVERDVSDITSFFGQAEVSYDPSFNRVNYFNAINIRSTNATTRSQ